MNYHIKILKPYLIFDDRQLLQNKSFKHAAGTNKPNIIEVIANL